MRDSEVKSFLQFLKSAEQLKNTLRSARTSNGRVESTAEHTWRLCLMVLLFEEQYPDLDMLKLMKICLIHDLGEAISGDVAAVDQLEGQDKNIEERNDLLQLLAPLPEGMKSKILELWDEYDAASSAEAKLAKAFDKIETIIQHNQGKNPPDFNYGFNLHYGKQYTNLDPLTSKIRTMLDLDTKLLADKQGN